MATQTKTKGGANGYAALVKARTAAKKSGKKPKRRKLDDYETPPEHTIQLLRVVKFRGKALEPAAGSGRMANQLRFAGLKVTTSDIKTGQNFLERKASNTFPGHVITNPPYRDGLADLFVRQGLKIADGQVAMLLECKFLFGERRYESLFAECPPSHVIYIPERIYFHEGSGPQIKSQFYNHVWIVWPDRKTRAKGGYPTLSVWAKPSSEFE